MRFKLLTGGALLAMAVCGVSAAQAQDIVTCSDFMSMDAQTQAATVDQIVQSMPSDQVTSPSSSSSPNGSNGAGGDSPVGVAQVQSACQSSGTSTVNDIIAQIQDNSGSSDSDSN